MAHAKIAPARLAAFDILLRIEGGDGHSDELLRSRQVEILSEADKNLCTNLVMGTLRWQIALDAKVRASLSRPDNKLTDEVLIALRLGAFQLLHLDRIPAHAAIGESVEMAKRGGNKYAAGMVNAVLRKVAAAPRADVPADRAFTSAAELAAELAHPAWMVERWVARYGLEAATKICRFDQEIAPATVRLFGEDIEETEGALKSEGVELVPAEFLAQARRVVKGNVTTTVAYRKGLVRIQDEGSQLVAELTGNGTRILDCCAAPGGKTAILVERNPAAEIIACDVSARRTEQMKGLLRGLEGAGQVRFQVADAAKASFREEFDLVLCDVPCSGTGTLARNPEIRHRINDAAILRQQERQIAILLGALQALKKGGRLLYSTCSLEPEENEAVVSACLAQREGYRVVPLEAELDRIAANTACSAAGAISLREHAFADGYLRTLPGVQNCDGFFAAMIERL